LIVAPPANALISLTPGTVSALTPFAPGATGTASGTLIATDASSSWTLQAQDTGSGAGKLVASTTGCTGSDSVLSNALQLSASSTLSGVNSAGTISLGSGNQTVASSTTTALAATVLNSSYTQVVPDTQTMLTGCAYSITVTYTLQ
jgi:hypothetical protein